MTSSSGTGSNNRLLARGSVSEAAVCHISDKPVYRPLATMAERDGWISDLPASPNACHHGLGGAGGIAPTQQTYEVPRYASMQRRRFASSINPGARTGDQPIQPTGFRSYMLALESCSNMACDRGSF
jgi:hypothetical protein